jgi:hypothetical protein
MSENIGRMIPFFEENLWSSEKNKSHAHAIINPKVYTCIEKNSIVGYMDRN